MYNILRALWKYYVIGALLTLLTGCGGAAPAASGDSAPARTPMITANTTPTGTISSMTTTSLPSPVAVQDESGIEGRTVIGPICPVARANQPCPPKPYQATINIMDSRNQHVAQVQSDAQGQFRIALPVGTYMLVPVALGVYPRAAQQMVTVTASSYISVTIAYDSGIR